MVFPIEEFDIVLSDQRKIDNEELVKIINLIIAKQNEIDERLADLTQGLAD